MSFFPNSYTSEHVVFNINQLPYLFHVTNEVEGMILNMKIEDDKFKSFLILELRKPLGLMVSLLHSFKDIGRFLKVIYIVWLKFYWKSAIPKILNDTLISIIPKIYYPQSIVHFRPISFCNTIYKVISKVIFQSLGCLMSKLVGPNQASFIPRRHITKNIVVAHKILNHFNR